MNVYVLSCIAIFLISLVSYIAFSKGNDKKDVQVCVGRFIIPNVILWLAQSILGIGIVSMYGMWALLIGASWILVIPILQYKSCVKVNDGEGDKSVYAECSRDINLGCYMTVFYFILNSLPILRNALGSMLLYLVFICFMLIPVFYVMHYVIYRRIPAGASIQAIQETYWKEAVEYISTYVEKKKLLALTGIYLWGTATFFYAQGRLITETVEYEYILYVIAAVMVLLIKNAFKKTVVPNLWKAIKLRRWKDLEYKKNASNRSLTVKKCSLPGTIIMVIGESASRDRMHVYNPEIEYDNTPWLDKMKDTDNMLLFANAYACYNQTSEVLKRVLTEMSQYNAVEFQDAASVIEVAKAMGYKTYWFSNQGNLKFEDSPEAMIADMADIVCGNSDARRTEYDQAMLDWLKQVNPNENNFVVLHLIGSHGRYQLRYPHSWAKWPSDTEESAYHNTLRYTDEFLEKLYDYAEENLHLQSMLYFSDHGDNLQYGHHPDIRTPDTVRIPMFVWLSDEYRQRFPDKIAALQQHKEEYFSNDMMYNTVLGLLDADCDRYDPKEDISSAQYGYNKDTVKTFLGDVLASDYDK